MFNLFRRRDEILFDIVAENGNNVEAAFDFVERIVRLAAFDDVASTLLLVLTVFNENDVADGRRRVTRDEQRVLRGG